MPFFSTLEVCTILARFDLGMMMAGGYIVLDCSMMEGVCGEKLFCSGFVGLMWDGRDWSSMFAPQHLFALCSCLHNALLAYNGSIEYSESFSVVVESFLLKPARQVLN